LVRDFDTHIYVILKMVSGKTLYIDFHSSLFGFYDKFENDYYIKIFENDKAYLGKGKKYFNENLEKFASKEYPIEYKLDKNQYNILFQGITFFQKNLKESNFIL
jgi:hypothetical protein